VLCAGASPARSSNSFLERELGVTRLVDSERTIMATINPHVNFSSKSPVFLTPIMLLALDPPARFDKPPPFEFWANTTNTSKTAIKMMIPTIRVNITTSSGLQFELQSKSFFAETSK